MMKITYILLISLITLTSAQANYIIPDDYGQTKKFIKVSTESVEGHNFYFFHECEGEITTSTCTQVYYQNGYSQNEISSIKKSQRYIGVGILATEIAIGGFIWKKLMKFTLGKATRMTAARTGWSEGIANGTVALVMPPLLTLSPVILLYLALRIY